MLIDGEDPDYNDRNLYPKSMTDILREQTDFDRRVDQRLGGIKHDQEKPDYSLLSPYAIEQLVLVLTFGKKKYAAHNWRRGLAVSRLIRATLSHTFKYLRGEDNDPESGISHIAHAMCNCMFILELMHTSRREVDDRYVEKVSESVTQSLSPNQSPFTE